MSIFQVVVVCVFLMTGRVVDAQYNRQWIPRCRWIGTCPQVTEDCRMLEVIVFEWGGQRCQGCPFCLDGPFLSSHRSRRSVQQKKCPVPCPQVSVSCDKVKLISTTQGDADCQRCPVCVTSHDDVSNQEWPSDTSRT